MYSKRLKPYFYLGGLYLCVSLLLRVVFIFHPITKSDFSFFESLKMLSIGVVNDILIFIPVCCIFTLYTLFLSESKFKRPWGIIIFSLLLLAFLYAYAWPNNIFMQYGKSVLRIVYYFLGIKTLIFGLMLFLPKQRLRIRDFLYFFTLFLFVVSIVLNSVSEYFFWNEFGVRYNFIAVDYLIYTNEVIGNIIESYPVLPLFSAIFIISGLISFLIWKKTRDNLNPLPNFKQKLILLAIYLPIFGISFLLTKPAENIEEDNLFSNEIQDNGLYKFYYAFNHSELDFNKFYEQLPEKEAEEIYLDSNKSSEIPEKILNEAAEIRKNVVLISVESLSAEFLKMYGNDENLTPFLDSIANHSLVFTNFYATGNRTVRGLEALSMCIPPSPGESIIKRKDNKDKFTIGSVFKSKDYQVKYLYGGYSYFDNMRDFFEGNGYDIVDRSNFKPTEITFANVWGVSDEDMARKAIEVMNREHKIGKPFFNHWMTVSNHRPFTYPEGRIDIPGTAQSRNGGVKYTDYSIGLFFKMAKKQEWYKNTIFVIVADHCASSAGKTELPLAKYRIPAMIFAPDGSVPADHFDGLMSQIDLMPTVLGLLNFNYDSKFTGKDVFGNEYSARAFIATYQDLGLLKDGFLTILSPVKKISQYKIVLQTEQPAADYPIYYDQIPVQKINKKLADETISDYQTVYNYLKNGKFNN